MEGVWLGLFAVGMTAFITSCNNAENVAIDCATKGKYESKIASVAVDCSIVKVQK